MVVERHDHHCDDDLVFMVACVLHFLLSLRQRFQVAVVNPYAASFNLMSGSLYLVVCVVTKRCKIDISGVERNVAKHFCC